MGLVDIISRKLKQEPAKVSTYDEQFIVAKLDLIKRTPKKFFLKLTTMLFCAFYECCNNDKIIRIKTNHSNSTTFSHKTKKNPDSLFAQPPDSLQWPNSPSNFKRAANPNHT